MSAIGHLPPSTSHLPPADDFHLPTGSTGDDTDAAKKKINDIIEACIDHRLEHRTVGNPNGYRQVVRREFDAPVQARIGALIADFPTAPVDVIAHGIETGDTSRLAHYTPQPEPEPDAPKLTAEQRAALLADAGAPTRLTVVPNGETA